MELENTITRPRIRARIGRRRVKSVGIGIILYNTKVLIKTPVL